jgi:hypothetical protein
MIGVRALFTSIRQFTIEQMPVRPISSPAARHVRIGRWSSQREPDGQRHRDGHGFAVDDGRRESPLFDGVLGGGIE